MSNDAMQMLLLLLLLLAAASAHLARQPRRLVFPRLHLVQNSMLQRGRTATAFGTRRQALGVRLAHRQTPGRCSLAGGHCEIVAANCNGLQTAGLSVTNGARVYAVLGGAGLLEYQPRVHFDDCRISTRRLVQRLCDMFDR